jgi:hypothetical protein
MEWKERGQARGKLRTEPLSNPRGWKEMKEERGKLRTEPLSNPRGSGCWIRFRHPCTQQWWRWVSLQTTLGARATRVRINQHTAVRICRKHKIPADHIGRTNHTALRFCERHTMGTFYTNHNGARFHIMPKSGQRTHHLRQRAGYLRETPGMSAEKALTFFNHRSCQILAQKLAQKRQIVLMLGMLLNAYRRTMLNRCSFRPRVTV